MNEEIYIVLWYSEDAVIYHEFNNELYHLKLDEDDVWCKSAHNSMQKIKECARESDEDIYNLLLEFEQENENSEPSFFQENQRIVLRDFNSHKLELIDIINRDNYLDDNQKIDIIEIITRRK